MKEIRIMNEFFHGPVWVYEKDGGVSDDFSVFGNDKIVLELNEQAADMYAAYFEFNSHDVACWFDEEKEKAEKEIMLDLITRIIARLNEINDGSFVINDCASEYLKRL